MSRSRRRRTPKSNGAPPFAADAGFDFDHDYALIVASFAYAYGLRIRQPDTRIPWPEFQQLLGALPPDAPLVQMVGVRTATDKEAEYFSAAQKQARADWQMWLCEQRSAAKHEQTAEGLEQMFQSLFG